MPKIMFFSDPHVGKVLAANTTPTSRARLRKSLAEFPLLAFEQIKSDARVCGGDLFDAYDSGVQDLRDAKRIADECWIVLGGNHDVENSLESLSSLAFLDEIYRFDDSQADSPVVLPRYGEIAGDAKRLYGTNLVCVPHHNTQELFDQALDAINIGGRGQDAKILLLHCNYDCDMATNETSLNLTRAAAQALLVNYDYILIGHDHNPKTDFDGRLIVMGSIHPTCFGDCHYNHNVYLFDTETQKFETIPVWEAEEAYFETTVDEILANWEQGLPRDIEFARVVGNVTPEQVPQLAKWVKRAWRSDNLFALRVDCQVRVERSTTNTQEPVESLSFKQRIENKLSESPELLNVWKLVTEEMGEQA